MGGEQHRAQDVVDVWAVREALHAWFRGNMRDFPWRRNRTPYRVWVAEIMLQQTRADQAVPYYRRFMRRFPSLRALAGASQGDVLKQWEGLGYYRRARNLHRAAQQVAQLPGGRFPRDYAGIRALPGIGAYTAAAIGSLAFDLPFAVVDGNVIRVLSRLFAEGSRFDSAAGKKVFQQLADELLAVERPGLHNEAMMELGALICLPRNPRCVECALRRHCRAFREHSQHDFPRRGKRKAIPHLKVGAGVIVDDRDRVLIAQRREGDMLGGLWEFPGGKCEAGETMRGCIRRELREEMGIDTRVHGHLMTVKHAYSHFTMDLHAYWCTVVSGRPRAIECAAVKWVARSELERFAMSKADDRIRARVVQKR